MSMLDLAKFDATILQREPCDYIIVPEFVRPAALDAINAEYPQIDKPGNFPLEELSFGKKFQDLIDELTGPQVREHFEKKFEMDLGSYPTQISVRKYMSRMDGNIHNDSRTKKITVLIYFNREWNQVGGQLRITRSEDNIDDYFVEIPPVKGTLFAFRRNERSFHGFPAAQGERRSLQMYWVEAKRLRRRKPTGFRKILHDLFRKAIGTR